MRNNKSVIRIFYYILVYFVSLIIVGGIFILFQDSLSNFCNSVISIYCTSYFILPVMIIAAGLFMATFINITKVLKFGEKADFKLYSKKVNILVICDKDYNHREHFGKWFAKAISAKFANFNICGNDLKDADRVFIIVNSALKLRKLLTQYKKILVGKEITLIHLRFDIVAVNLYLDFVLLSRLVPRASREKINFTDVLFTPESPEDIKVDLLQIEKTGKPKRDGVYLDLV